MSFHLIQTTASSTKKIKVRTKLQGIHARDEISSKNQRQPNSRELMLEMKFHKDPSYPKTKYLTLNYRDETVLDMIGSSNLPGVWILNSTMQLGLKFNIPQQF